MYVCMYVYMYTNIKHVYMRMHMYTTHIYITNIYTIYIQFIYIHTHTHIYIYIYIIYTGGVDVSGWSTLKTREGQGYHWPIIGGIWMEKGTGMVGHWSGVRQAVHNEKGRSI
jgi:hypothetical protein